MFQRPRETTTIKTVRTSNCLPRAKNGKPDTLSRRSEYRPEKGGSENQPITTVLQKNHFAAAVSRKELVFVCSSAPLGSLLARKWVKEFEEMVKEAGKKDEEYRRTREELEAVRKESALNGRKAEEEATDPHEAQWRNRKVRMEEVLGIKDGLLNRKGILWIPEDGNLKQTILESEHNPKVVGHMGQDKMIELIR